MFAAVHKKTSKCYWNEQHKPASNNIAEKKPWLPATINTFRRIENCSKLILKLLPSSLIPIQSPKKTPNICGYYSIVADLNRCQQTGYDQLPLKYIIKNKTKSLAQAYGLCSTGSPVLTLCATAAHKINENNARVRSKEISYGPLVRIQHFSKKLTLQAPTPQNSLTHSKNSPANTRRMVWVCLTILWG